MKIKPRRPKKSSKNPKGAGPNKKWRYNGEKKVLSIRLTDTERDFIKKDFDSVQAFVQYYLNILRIEGRDK